MNDLWFLPVVAAWSAAALLIPYKWAWKGNISRAIRKLPFLRKFQDTTTLWLFLWFASLSILVLTDTKIIWLYIGDGIRRLDDWLTMTTTSSDVSSKASATKSNGRWNSRRNQPRSHEPNDKKENQDDPGTNRRANRGTP